MHAAPQFTTLIFLGALCSLGAHGGGSYNLLNDWRCRGTWEGAQMNVPLGLPIRNPCGASELLLSWSSCREWIPDTIDRRMLNRSESETRKKIFPEKSVVTKHLTYKQKVTGVQINERVGHDGPSSKGANHLAMDWDGHDQIIIPQLHRRFK